jgi:signal transduction histidine kinase
MKTLLTLFSPSPYIQVPRDLAGWIGWLFFAGLVPYLLWRWRRYNKPLDLRALLAFAGLLALTIITSQSATPFFLGFRLPAATVQPLPGFPADPLGPAVMLFAALPFFVAGGFFGPLMAVVLGLVSGIVKAAWDTHNLFTPVEMALLAGVISAALNQRYRTTFFRLVRRPIAAAALASVLYALITLIDAPFTVTGVLVNRLDYAVSNFGATVVVVSIELLLAGAFTEFIAFALPDSWGSDAELLPSPSERSLRTRFLYSLAPLAVILIVMLVAGDWLVAGRAAREMLRERMSGAAQVATATLPYFFETGHSLITQYSAELGGEDLDPADVRARMLEDMRKVPYFRQLYLLDANEETISGYPHETYIRDQAPLEEQVGIDLALEGFPVQSYTISPVKDDKSALVTFIASVQDNQGNITGILIGRSDLISNPFTLPILSSLETLDSLGGKGFLLDENGRVVYHKDPDLLMSLFPISEETTESIIDSELDYGFYSETGPDGSPQMVYYQRAEGRPWTAVLTVPANRTQQMALQIAAPLVALIVLLSGMAALVVSFSLRRITGSLHQLSFEAGRIAEGQLDQPLTGMGEDEVGTLRHAFEQMRARLKARLDELNRLLMVSQGVASSLEMGEAVHPVLEAALVSGACSARVVLAPSIVPELDGSADTPLCFSTGRLKDQYAELDETILNLNRQQDRMLIANSTITRPINPAAVHKRPASILALALRHENMYYGSLWVAYDQQHIFSDEEVRFLTTLAGQAAVAAANARLFLNAEIGRQRLAAILASTPDPVLVTDQNDRLLLANPAAWQALDLGMETGRGSPIGSLIHKEELLNLLRASAAEDDKPSAEVIMPDGKIYLATASSVLAEGQRVGRVCVLRDVTRFKELDTLKSEFVSTVSHDLRSPLTTIHGYATMLDILGELNEHQVGFVRKIVSSVEGMSHLVENLLSLGRLEAGVGLQLELVPVRDLVEKVVSAQQAQATQKEIQVAVEIPEGSPVLIEADQILLNQALQNLVENAVKFTRAKGKVAVRVENRQGRLIFEIRDTGIGISPMDQTRLFEKFYRVTRPGAKEQLGTGLGLAIVKSIAERHGGEVWVESQLGKGSAFFLSIPVRQTESGA